MPQCTLLFLCVGLLCLFSCSIAEVTVTNVSPQQKIELGRLKQEVLAGNSHAFLDLCRYMMELGLHAQAATMCENFIERSDGDPAGDIDLRDAYRIWGDALRETGRYVLSAKAYTIAFKAGDDSAASGLVLSLTWTGLFDGARRAIAATQRRLGPDKNVAEIFTPWVALLLGFSPRDCLASARAASRTAVLAAADNTIPLPPLPPPRTRTPLTVAYVSADFNGFAPVGHDLKRALSMHNPLHVRTVCVALSPEDGSPLRAAMRQSCPRFVSLAGLSAHDAARELRALQTDIVVDLTGHTAGARPDVLALRGARTQIAMKGFMGSMGAPFIDYGAVDRIAVPPDRARDFDERLAVFPHSVFVCDLKQEHAHVLESPLPRSARRDYGLPVDAFIFACFNRLFKLDDVTFALWMQILQRTPNSVLWLLRFPPDAVPALHAAADSLGVPRDRIVFTELFSAKEHLRIKGLADVFLDTLRFNAHGTAAEAVWAGLPVLTAPGHTMSQRVAAGIVQAALMPEHAWALDYLIASSTEDYVNKAVALGSDRGLYARVAQAVRASRAHAPLFDTQGWMDAAEVLYGMTADLAAAGRAPQHIVLCGRTHAGSDSVSQREPLHEEL